MKKVIIYGAGGNYRDFAPWLKERFEIVALVDGNEEITGHKCEGLQVRQLSVLTESEYDLVIVTPNDNEAIIKMLISVYRVPEEKICVLEDIVFGKNRGGDIRVCFNLIGGFGDAIIGYDYIFHFYEHFKEYGIRIDIVGASKALTDFVGDDTFVERFADRDVDKYDYDLVIDLRRYPRVARAEYYRISRLVPRMIEYLDLCRRFELGKPELIHFGPVNDGAGSDYEIGEGRRRYEQPDICGALGVNDEYGPEIGADIELLNDHGLSDEKFITIHRGCDKLFYSPDNVKLWEEENYEELIRMIKKEYPGHKIVLLGEEYERSANIKSADLDFVGKTDIPHLKSILKYAKLHIDTEGGLVHMRHALRGGASVVLFGPTSDLFFGYPENTNIRTDVCPKPCEWETKDWANNCGNKESLHCCMKSITPQMVFEKLQQII